MFQIIKLILFEVSELLSFENLLIFEIFYFKYLIIHQINQL